MDTDRLSRESYQGIILEAEKFSRDLTLHYALLCSECKDEGHYLSEAEKLTKLILQADKEDLEDLFWENPPEKVALDHALKSILENIEKIKSIPMSNRLFEL